MPTESRAVGSLHIEIRGAEKLSFRERQVVVLKESGQTAAAIARRLSITEATVATLYRRARAKGYQVVIILDAGVLGLDGVVDPDEPGDLDGADEPGTAVEG